MTDDPTSIADKLYAPFRPSLTIHQQRVEFYKRVGYCGESTGIQIVREEHITAAMNLMVEHEINAEPSGAAGLEMFLQNQDKVPSGSTVVVVNTGDLKIEEPPKSKSKLSVSNASFAKS